MEVGALQRREGRGERGGGIQPVTGGTAEVECA